MKKIHDLSGKRFGKWTAISRVVIKNASFWTCVCDCGTTKNVMATSLLSGESNGCKPCSKTGYDLSGTKFNEITVIKRVPRPENKKGRLTFYQCKCSCGKELIISRPNILSKKQISCGCVHDSKRLRGRAAFSVWNDRIAKYEKTEDRNGLLFVECSLCKNMFNPTSMQVKNRLIAINGIRPGENRLYCSPQCKNSCPVFNKRSDFIGDERKRFDSQALKDIVKNLDNCECCMCGNRFDLVVHHINPVAIVPMLSLDPDNCITLCKECHKKVHSMPGCELYKIRRCVNV